MQPDVHVTNGLREFQVQMDWISTKIGSDWTTRNAGGKILAPSLSFQTVNDCSVNAIFFARFSRRSSPKKRNVSHGSDVCYHLVPVYLKDEQFHTGTQMRISFCQPQHSMCNYLADHGTLGTGKWSIILYHQPAGTTSNVLSSTVS